MEISTEVQNSLFFTFYRFCILKFSFYLIVTHILKNVNGTHTTLIWDLKVDNNRWLNPHTLMREDRLFTEDLLRVKTQYPDFYTTIICLQPRQEIAQIWDAMFVIELTVHYERIISIAPSFPFASLSQTTFFHGTHVTWEWTMRELLGKLTVSPEVWKTMGLKSVSIWHHICWKGHKGINWPMKEATQEDGKPRLLTFYY